MHYLKLISIVALVSSTSALAEDIKVGSDVMYNVFHGNFCLGKVTSLEADGKIATLDVSPVGCDHNPKKLFSVNDMWPVKLSDELIEHYVFANPTALKVGQHVTARRSDFTGKKDDLICEGIVEALVESPPSIRTPQRLAKVKYLNKGCYDDSTFFYGSGNFGNYLQTSNRLMSLSELTAVEPVKSYGKVNVGQKIYFTDKGLICSATAKSILNTGLITLANVQNCDFKDPTIAAGNLMFSNKSASDDADGAAKSDTGTVEAK